MEINEQNSIVIAINVPDIWMVYFACIDFGCIYSLRPILISYNLRVFSWNIINLTVILCGV
jgi:hypothetical protein